MSADIRAFATCPRGLESLLIEELRDLNVVEARETIGGVRFAGGMREVYNACLWTRTSSRVLLPLTSFEVDSQDALYEGVKRVEWEDHIPNDGTIAVDFNGKNVHVRNTQFGAQRARRVSAGRACSISRPCWGVPTDCYWRREACVCLGAGPDILGLLTHKRQGGSVCVCVFGY